MLTDLRRRRYPARNIIPGRYYAKITARNDISREGREGREGLEGLEGREGREGNWAGQAGRAGRDVASALKRRHERALAR